MASASVYENGFLNFIFKILKKILLTFREGGREGEKHQCARELHQSVASRVSPTRDLAHNLGMHPGWELNQRPFGLQAGAQSTEPHQPGRVFENNL